MNLTKVIEAYQHKSSKSNCMEKWNELIAGFVLGNLTPEEAESITQILAENPQLARHIARLRNTATVRSLGKAEWSTARSQDGSEGWADTALDRSLPDRLSSSPEPDRLSVDRTITDSILSGKQIATEASLGGLDAETTPAAAPPDTNTAKTNTAKEAAKKKQRDPHLTFERFSLTEALLVPLFNPLWWTAIAVAVAIGIDNLRVRRSLEGAIENLSKMRTTPQIVPTREMIKPPETSPNNQK